MHQRAFAFNWIIEDAFIETGKLIINVCMYVYKIITQKYDQVALFYALFRYV